jgi:hypothetical protein
MEESCGSAACRESGTILQSQTALTRFPINRRKARLPSWRQIPSWRGASAASQPPPSPRRGTNPIPPQIGAFPHLLHGVMAVRLASRMYSVKQTNLCTSCTMDCEPLDSNWAYEIYCWYILQKKPFKAVDLHENSFQIPSSSSSLYCTCMSFHCWAIRVLGSSMVRLPAHENGGEFHSSIAKPVVPYFKFEFSYYLRA